MNYQTLWTELDTDPLTRGYSGMTDQQAADSLNTANRTRNLSSITGDVAFQQTNGAEFAALTDAKKSLWMAFCGRSEIDTWATANVAFVTWVFGGASATVASLANSRTVSVSRATELGLPVISAGLVAEARQWGVDN